MSTVRHEDSGCKRPRIVRNCYVPEIFLFMSQKMRSVLQHLNFGDISFSL